MCGAAAAIRMRKYSLEIRRFVAFIPRTQQPGRVHDPFSVRFPHSSQQNVGQRDTRPE
jgi:hypothetical protein